jgi:Protein of unknown function (DUF4230)
MIKKYMTWLWIILGIVVGITLFKLFNGITSTSTGGFNFSFLIIGLLGGAILMYLLSRTNLFGTTTSVKQDSTIMLQKIERVFKVVTAEGHFSEIFDYSNTSNITSFLPITSTKKALLIVNAKVMMGFDFKKCKFEIDAQTGKINIVSFPKPEVLSIEPDIKYYNMENGLFNKFDNNDLTKLQAEAKQKILDKIPESELPQIAQKQMQQLMGELKTINNWQLIGEEKMALP